MPWAATTQSVVRFGNDTIDGGSGTDTLNGGTGNDLLFGGADNDTLNGDAGNDTLDGGTGNDILSGGLGNNLYLFGKGDGQDMISMFNDATTGKFNTLQFKAGVLPSDVITTRVGVNCCCRFAGRPTR